MSLKLRGLGVAVLAATAMNAIAVMNATAETGGHFVSEVSHTIVDQSATPGSGHSFAFTSDDSSVMECTFGRLTGTDVNATTTQPEGTTDIGECYTAGTETHFAFHENGCKGRATVAPGGTGTGDLICPAGKVMEVTHPNCLITVGPQNNISGFTYTNIVNGGEDAITLDVNVQYTVQYHGGICIFLGTTHGVSMVGSTVIKGFHTNGERVGITAT